METRHLTRYWAADLAPHYAKAKLTPTSGQYGVQRTIIPAAYRGLTHTLLKTPADPLGERLRADVFQPLTVARSSNLVPPRPCFAPFPTNTRKRKMNAVAQKKTGLQDSFDYTRVPHKPRCFEAGWLQSEPFTIKPWIASITRGNTWHLRTGLRSQICAFTFAKSLKPSTHGRLK